MFAAQNEMTKKSALLGAKIGLAVTVFALLAACSAKPVEGEVDMTPVAANEVVPAPTADATPFPEADSAPVAAAPAARQARVKKHFAGHHRNHRRKMIAKNAHRASKKLKKNVGSAVGQISKSLPPSAPSLPEVAAAPAPTIPLPTTTESLGSPSQMLTAEEAAPSHRSWLIWSLLIGATVGLGLVYRASKARRSRALVFN